jgi:hypothetical protein
VHLELMRAIFHREALRVVRDSEIEIRVDDSHNDAKHEQNDGELDEGDSLSEANPPIWTLAARD